MKNHPRIGYDLVSDNPGLRKASDVILMHHEWVNGSGYPQGLEGTQIPLLARICTVADSMDAMMTDRPYREGKKESEVRSELTKHKGIQFDPEIVDIVLSLDWQQFYNPLGSPVISAVGTVPPVGLSEFDSV
jgi:HD-GYP domain-containing protein (c-di-GMP phosphodiesterase class II)